MEKKIKIICFILITLTVITGIGFYCWKTWEERKYYEREETKEQREEVKEYCIRKVCYVGVSGSEEMEDIFKVAFELCIEHEGGTRYRELIEICIEKESGKSF